MHQKFPESPLVGFDCVMDFVCAFRTELFKS